MKGRNLIAVGLIALLTGILMIIFRDSLASGGVVRIAGLIFVGAGVLNITTFLGSRDREGRARMGAFGTVFGWIVSGAAVILGLSMLMFSHVFVALVGFMFGVLVLFAALFQIFVLLFGARPAKVSNWFFLVPMALLVCAVIMFVNKPEVQGERTIMLMSGIALGVFGLATIAEGAVVGSTNRSLKAKDEESK